MASGQVRQLVFLYIIVRIVRFLMNPNVGAKSVRGSARHRGRGSWELTVWIWVGIAEGKRVRSFRTVRGTRTEAERVLNGMFREADMGAGNYRPACSWEISWGVGRRSGCLPRLRSQTCRWYDRAVPFYLLRELGDIPVDRLTAAQISGMEVG